MAACKRNEAEAEASRRQEEKALIAAFPSKVFQELPTINTQKQPYLSGLLPSFPL
jgi:hypothetical protein